MSEYESVMIRTKDRVVITGYLIKRPVQSIHGLSNCTLLYLHANAGNMGHRLPIARVLWEKLNCNVFMLSYRGYGKSEGQPNEKGIKIDAQAALDYILKHDKLKNTKIIVYGQSIGGAVAIHLASQNSHRVNALIVENTFLSIPKLIPSVFKYLSPFSFLCHQIWDSEKHIKATTDVPILFLSGKHDELIPQSHMKSLYQTAVHERTKLNGSANDVRFIEFDQGKHNDTCIQDGYFDAIVSFWNSKK